MKRLHRQGDESGIAMITAILVSAVILTLSVTATSLSIHNSNSSGLDRKRVQVIAAAEAGLDATMSSLATTPTASLPCSVTGSTSASPAQQYTAAITYYDAGGNPMTCLNPGVSFAPSKAVVKSTAFSSPGAIQPGAKRTMQTEVQLHPLYGGFGSAIFSDQSPTTSNNITVNGQSGDDANVYTNGSWSCGNSMTVHGAMTAQGSVTMSNSCQVTRDVWANGAVTMSNNTLIGHNVTSSTSSITLNNSAHVLNNARAGTTIASNGHIDGSATANSPQAAPPAQTLPTVTFDQTAWQNAGWSVQNQTCTQVAAITSVTTKTVYRITGGCALSWSNNSTINLSADVAIVTDGSISMANKTTFQSGDGNQHTLMFIMPTGSSCPGASFSTSNNTSFTNLRTFVFTPCNASFANKNAGIGGQIFAGNVTISNQFSLNYIPEVIPGAGSITGYNVDITYLREIVNP